MVLGVAAGSHGYSLVVPSSSCTAPNHTQDLHPAAQHPAELEEKQLGIFFWTCWFCSALSLVSELGLPALLGPRDPMG